MNKVINKISWIYLIFVMVILIILYLYSDRWHPATLILFGPRWAIGLPLIILFPASCYLQKKINITLLFTIVIIAWPIMGLKFNFNNTKDLNNKVIRVLSCNIGGKYFKIEKLSELIKNLNVDIVSLQEWNPNLKLDLPQYWNKLELGTNAIFSKFKININTHQDTINRNHPTRNHLLTCTIDTPWEEIFFNTVHFPSPRNGLHSFLHIKIMNPKKRKSLTTEIEYRKNISQIIQSIIINQNKNTIIAGDFNTPVESTIFQSDWKEFNDSFSISGQGYGWTFRDSLQGVPIDIRIDHILTNKGLTPLVCEVGPNVGSEHRPIVADILID